MKTYKSLIFTAFILISQLQYAQIKVGGKAGFSLGNLSENSSNLYSKDFESITGYDFGVFTEFAVSDQFAVRLEVLSTRKGGRRDGIQPIPLEGLLSSGQDINFLNQLAILSGGTTITDQTPLFANYSNKSELTYLEIPLLGRYSWGNQERFYVEAGPYIGILIKAEQITIGNSTFYADEVGNLPLIIPNPLGGTPFSFPEQTFSERTDVIDNLERTNYGVQFGLGFFRDYDNKHEISFGVRATYGFVPIQKNETFGNNKIGSITFNFSYARIFGKSN